MGHSQKQSGLGSDAHQVGDPYRWGSMGLVLAILGTPMLLIAISWYGSSPLRHMHGTREAMIFPVSSAPSLSGAELFAGTCALCHGGSGEGVANLGKPLRNSAYVQEQTDELLFDLIANGRMPDDPMNTSGVLMPARGAKNINDDEVHLVVSYLREIQDLDAPHVSVESWEKATPLEVAAADSSLPDLPGRDLFVSSCSACHGADGEGIEGLGKSFRSSEFVTQSSDKELTTMIKMGRPIWDAANTTGIDMPPKGGNPALNDEQLAEIIAYIRSISGDEG